MRNPPIVRAVISDVQGDVLFDSAAPQYARRLESVRPVIVRLAPPPPPPPPPPARAIGWATLSRKERRSIGALIAGLAAALASGALLVLVTLLWGAR